MHVVDHAPQSWYLLRDDDTLLLDLNCSQGAVSVDFLLELSAEERAAYAGRGRARPSSGGDPRKPGLDVAQRR